MVTFSPSAKIKVSAISKPMYPPPQLRPVCRSLINAATFFRYSGFVYAKIPSDATFNLRIKVFACGNQ
jgi:hypothetical protein